jgi:hypothetical protein
MMELAVIHGKANNLVVAIRELRSAAAELSRPRFDLLDKALADATARLVAAVSPDAVCVERLAAALAILHGGCRETFYLKRDQPLSDSIRTAKKDLPALRQDTLAAEIRRTP